MHLSNWAEWLGAVARRRGTGATAPGGARAAPPAPDDRLAEPRAPALDARDLDARVLDTRDLDTRDLDTRPTDAVAELERWQEAVYDLLGDGVLLFTAGGALAHRNAAAGAMIDGASGDALLREARALAVASLARDARRRELTLQAERYRLTAAPTPAPLRGAPARLARDAPAVLVALTRLSPPFPTAAALHHRFQLTARESSVALLLAEGRNNGSIARRLGISAHTVRHYIETVLLKLDVPTRAAVAAALLGTYERTDEHPLPAPRRAPGPARGD